MSEVVHRARVETGGAVLAERLRLAHTPWARLRGRLGTALCNLALAALYSLFVAAHVSRAHGPIDVARVVSYAIIVQMTILAVLFVARRPSADTSNRPLDWVTGVGGTFLPLLLRRTDPPAGLAWLGGPMQLVGASAVAVAAVYLGRSFGLVAANRGVQLGGAYRLVRHPMYGAHALGYLGYVLTYPSAANVMVVGATLLLLNARAVAEERILARDPAYREYLQRLPWRFLPYVY